MLLGCFDYIAKFLYKILAHLSGFGFILCRKKQQLKCSITYTAKHVHVQYKQRNLRCWFFGPLRICPDIEMSHESKTRVLTFLLRDIYISVSHAALLTMILSKSRSCREQLWE